MNKLYMRILALLLVLSIALGTMLGCEGILTDPEGENGGETGGDGAGSGEVGGEQGGDGEQGGSGNTNGDGSDDGESGGSGNTNGDGSGALAPFPSGDDPVTSDPYTNVDKTAFYADYTPAVSYMDSFYRTKHKLMSGSITLPDAAPTAAEYRPISDGRYVKNTGAYYSEDGNTYYVLDGYGNYVMSIYRGGAYITLEEVAAHMYAFGELPANYTSKKSGKPSSDPWGEYLRLNHSHFSGDVARYPYEPRLPNINGCGGDMQYYEMDIGTTGTHTGHRDDGKSYNNGSSIVRGGARIVYARQDLNRNGIYEIGEVYLFYTYNHYNDFEEYLNYYGGWGEMFGNITGGGQMSSKTSYNPTPYVEVTYSDLRAARSLTVAILILPHELYLIRRDDA